MIKQQQSYYACACRTWWAVVSSVFFHSIVTAKYTAYLHTEKDTGERSETTY
jgi:hypothetical protein